MDTSEGEIANVNYTRLTSNGRSRCRVLIMRSDSATTRHMIYEADNPCNRKQGPHIDCRACCLDDIVKEALQGNKKKHGVAIHVCINSHEKQRFPWCKNFN